MNIIQYQYPFDPNGVLPSNLITNENHNITASAGLPYNFIIPRKGPYFADSLVVTHPASGRTLDVGVDYSHSYLFQQQSNTEPFLMVYGGISLLTTEYDGAVLSLQYQTLGGEYALPEADILAILANAHIDPRLTTWDSVAFRPGEYHPEAHLHHVSTTMGWDDLVLAVRDLIEKIRVESGELAALFEAHINDLNNPHETDLVKLGIERFANVYRATLEQANIGTDNINYITPHLLRDVLNNTDLITKVRVGLGLVENFPPATSTEILLGTIGRYVTADLLKEYYARKNGEGASGLWDISVSGNAATATRLLAPRLINRRPFDGTANLEVSEWFHSDRDFLQGTLVTTNINYAVADGDPWCLEVTGNPYSGGNEEAFETKAYGYIYNGTMINIGGHHNGYLMTGIVAMNIGGNLCFWWPRYAYWQGFNVRVYSASNNNQNRVVSITNSADPGGTKRVTISDKLQDKPIRRGQSSTFVIPESGRSAGVSWSGLSDHHHIYAERYAGSQSTRLVIQNEDDDDDYTVFRHVLPSGSSPVDTFEVRRTVVRSNVFFEHVGMNRISDGTLKLNQSEVNYDDFDIDQLSLMNWTWADDERVPAELRGKPGQGVIAQEVMKVFPDCVRESDKGILRVDDAALATKLSIILLKKLKKLGL